MRMLFAFLLIALTHTRCAEAAPPPIYPGEIGSESDSPIVKFSDAGCLVAWFYDLGDHRWTKDGFYGSGADCTKANQAMIEAAGLDPTYLPNWVLGYAIGYKLSKLSHAQKDKLWNDVFNIYPGDPQYAAVKALNDANDAQEKIIWDALPYPTSIPPSGLVTQDVVVYKRTVIASTTPEGSWVFKPLGSIALGKSCNDKLSSTGPIIGKTGNYTLYQVDRRLVSTPVKNTPIPIDTYALCKL